MKKFRNLDKTWKEILFSASGFGPNLLMVLMGAFFTDAVNPAALNAGENAVQTITGFCLITPALFSILWFIGKVFDGIIDIPFANVTDNLKSKWGRRRLPIAICFIPMVVSYTMCWIPISLTNTLANTIWIFVWALIFFATYTMNLICFYGSLSTVCADESQRLRVSSFKSFFDTISYCLVYALVPLILKVANIHIDKLVFILLPTMLTMIIPLFMIKEGEKWEAKAKEQGYDIKPLKDDKGVKIGESIKLTVTNKPFMKWVLVNCCSFFGLQMFLVAMNALILGGMGLDSGKMAILNTCAFAPVPLMLYLFSRLKERKGIRFAYQLCLLLFAVAILSFDIASTFIMGNNDTLKIIVGAVGGVCGSFAIGSFFMMPYMVPAQISSVEEKLTGKNHSAMYFAAQAVTTSIVGAFASSIVYENIKSLFFARGGGIVKALDEGGKSAIENAAELLHTSPSQVFNLGTLIVPLVVSLFCILGFILAFRMPKDYNPELVAKELGLEKEYLEHKDLFDEKKEQKIVKESLIVCNSLWVLTGSIFAYIWAGIIGKNINKEIKKCIHWYDYLLAILIPPYFIYLMIKENKQVNEKAASLGLNLKKQTGLVILFTCLGLTLVSLSLIQTKLNKIADCVNE